MPEALLVFLAAAELGGAGAPAGRPGHRERGRGGERRLETARVELAAEAEFDVTVVNADVDEAADELVALMGLARGIVAELHVGHVTFVDGTEGALVSGTVAAPRASPTRRSTSCSRQDRLEVHAGDLRAKRARQINAYYSQLGEGLLEYVGPLVETHVQEKPLSIALREINAGLLTSEASTPRPRRAPPTRDAEPDPDRMPPTAIPATAPAARVVLGVGGGIAAYKACELLRRFTESGHDVTRRPDRAPRCDFVGAATWAALSGQPVAADGLGRRPRGAARADRPAGRPRRGRPGHRRPAGPGRARRSPTTCSPTTLLTARCPVVFAPAMHTEMWEHPATQANVATLRARGARRARAGRRPAHRRRHRHGPAARARGDLAAAVAALGLVRSAPEPDLAGRTVVVTAGGTREPLDPVRFLGNRRSGKQGYALAAAAAARGAQVTLVAANVALPDPAGVDGRPGRHRRASCARPCRPPPRAPTPW